MEMPTSLLSITTRRIHLDQIKLHQLCPLCHRLPCTTLVLVEVHMAKVRQHITMRSLDS